MIKEIRVNKTSEAKRIRKELKEADIAFALTVKSRDCWKCVICGSDKNINCHHILPRERRDVRHNLLNGITLCVLHHKFSLNISPHKNAFEFFVWLSRNRVEQYIFCKSMCLNAGVSND
jgi:hypothetical protein